MNLSYSNEDDIITENTFFVFIDSRETKKICHPKMGKIRVLKKDIDLSFFIGKALNSFWEYNPDTNSYDEVTSNRFFKDNLIDGEVFDYSNEKILNANNKDIFTSSSEDQKQKAECILSLKEKGFKGKELVNESIKNNTSINKRTLLSQEKIIKKYENRHFYQIFLAKPTLLNVVEAFFWDRILSKIILSMRFDTIGTILQSMKFMDKSKSVVFDNTNGFLTSAIVSRTSNVMFCIYENKPSQRSISYFNYPSKIKKQITYFEFNSFIDKFGCDLFGFYKAFSNLVINHHDESKLIDVTIKLIPSLKPSGILVVYARDKEVSI